jgi:hypothetical protein
MFSSPTEVGSLPFTVVEISARVIEVAIETPMDCHYCPKLGNGQAKLQEKWEIIT